jgi:hypothetical protein
MNGISSPSANVSAVARSQYVAGAPKGKRRRVNNVRTRPATTGIETQRLIAGAPGELRPRTSSAIPARPRRPIGTSNQYFRARERTLLTP